VQSNYIHREINKKVIQTDINIPVSVHTSIFDEYIDLDYTTFLYAQNSAFSGSETVPTGEYRDGIIARNSNVVSASSQLTKAYDEFTHVVGFGSSYTFKGSETRNGFYTYNEEFCEDPANATHARCDFYGISQVKEELKLDFSQYVYDVVGQQILYHRLSQNILYTGIGSSKGDLENELEYRITDDLEFYNNMFYNHKQEKFSKIYNRLAYNSEILNISISHLYQDTFIPTTSTRRQYTDYLTSTVRYKYNKFYSYHFAYDYDLELQKKKRTEVGFLYSKRCWDFGMKYVENNRPVLDISGNTQGVRERYIYFTISLKPFMSTGGADSSLFAYKLPDE
jgi:LPS-assembly protein